MKVSVWESQSRGRVTQMLYTNATTRAKTRVLYGPQGIGAPTRILDEVTGESVVITTPVNGRVDFLMYDAAAKYVSGTAVVYRDAKLYMAPITSRPAFVGQINVATDRLSFALTATTADSGLGSAIEAPANYTKFIGDALAAPGSSEEFGANLTYAGLTWLAAISSTAGSSRPVASLAGGAHASRSASMRANLAYVLVGAVAVSYATGLLDAALNPIFDRVSADVSEKTHDGQNPENALESAWAKIKETGESSKRTIEEYVQEAKDWSADLKNEIADQFRSPVSLPSPSGGPPAPPSSVEGVAIDRSNTA
jgi:hypothetical protein